ncbi:MAG: biotin synthase BioB [Treponema sp.]|nr:biotin synthase BioB [Treponema sp.]
MNIETREEALSILNLKNDELPELLNIVYSIRKKYKGNRVGIQLLTNVRSGNCTQNCAYCAQSILSKVDIKKYSLVSTEKILKDGNLVLDNSLARHCLGLSGIRFSDTEINEFANQIIKLKKETQTPICCSIGLLTLDQAEILKKAGVDRINHNLNTSERFYPYICTTHTYKERIDNIKMLQSLGFEICCGGIIGLGEEKMDIVDMVFSIKEINPQAVPINFLIPIKGTPLENSDTAYLTAEYCLKILCLTRLLLPKSDIRCAAGREVYLKGWEKELFCVVDSVFASGYLTTDGDGIDETIKVIKDAGFEYYIESSNFE